MLYRTLITVWKALVPSVAVIALTAVTGCSDGGSPLGSNNFSQAPKASKNSTQDLDLHPEADTGEIPEVHRNDNQNG